MQLYYDNIEPVLSNLTYDYLNSKFILNVKSFIVYFNSNVRNPFINKLDYLDKLNNPTKLTLNVLKTINKIFKEISVYLSNNTSKTFIIPDKLLIEFNIEIIIEIMYSIFKEHHFIENNLYNFTTLDLSNVNNLDFICFHKLMILFININCITFNQSETLYSFQNSYLKALKILRIRNNVILDISNVRDFEEHNYNNVYMLKSYIYEYKCNVSLRLKKLDGTIILLNPEEKKDLFGREEKKYYSVGNGKFNLLNYKYNTFKLKCYNY